MNQNPEPGHEQYVEDLALYALGALEAGSRAQLEQHLRECPACRRELEALRGDAALLALAVSGPAPPERARERLLTAITAAMKEREQPGREPLFAARRPWWNFAPAFAALLLAIFAIFLLRESAGLQKEIKQLEAENRHARDVLALMTAKDAMHVSLVSTQGRMAPHASTIYQPKTGHLLLMAGNLHPLPAGMTYELWLIPKSGAPMPCGVFKPDATGAAMMMNMPDKPPGMEAKAFAVTMEPEGGSEKPTSDILLQSSGA